MPDTFQFFQPQWVDIRYSTSEDMSKRYHIAYNGLYTRIFGGEGVFNTCIFKDGQREFVRCSLAGMPSKVQAGGAEWTLMPTGHYLNSMTGLMLDPFTLEDRFNLGKKEENVNESKQSPKFNVEKHVTEVFLINGEVVEREEIEKLYYKLDSLLWN